MQSAVKVELGRVNFSFLLHGADFVDLRILQGFKARFETAFWLGLVPIVELHYCQLSAAYIKKQPTIFGKLFSVCLNCFSTTWSAFISPHVCTMQRTSSVFHHRIPFHS